LGFVVIIFISAIFVVFPLLNRPGGIQHCDWMMGWSIAGSSLEQGQDIFAFAKRTYRLCEPTEPHIQWGPGTCSGSKAAGTFRLTTSIYYRA
jgi:hypothetical protein